MNWLALANPNLIALIVMGIQAIHGQAKAGTAKKTLAMETLGLVFTTAQMAGLSIAQQQEANNAASAASYGIDAAVSTYQALGHPLFPVAVASAAATVTA